MSEPIPQHEEEVLGKAYDARLMRRLLGYVRPYGWMTALSLGFIFVGSLLRLAGPLITGVAVDLFIRPVQGQAGSSAASAWVRAFLLAHGIDPLRVAPQGITAAALFFFASVG